MRIFLGTAGFFVAAIAIMIATEAVFLAFAPRTPSLVVWLAGAGTGV